jgi:hypothetical protein
VAEAKGWQWHGIPKVRAEIEGGKDSSTVTLVSWL